MAVNPRQRPSKEKGKAKAAPGKAAAASLDFSSQHLPDGPPPSALHPGLFKLTLSSCDLRTLSFLHLAPRLSLLNLSGNAELRHLTDKEWSEAVGGLEGLCVLNLAKCGLKKVPKVVRRLKKLKALVVSENELGTLDEVKDLPELNTLVVSHNQLSKLPSTLTSLPSLKKLSASHNRLSSTGLPDLSALPCLREVRLTGNPDIDRLPLHLSKWGTADGSKGVEILELGGCSLRDMQALKPLKGMQALHHLSLKGNPLAAGSEDDFDAFKEQIVRLVPSLRILDGHRFDPKFLDSKSRRAARVDGPPSVVDPEQSRGKRRLPTLETREPEGQRPNKAKRRRTDDEAPVDRAAARMQTAAEDATAEDEAFEGVPQTTLPIPVEPPKKRKQRRTETKEEPRAPTLDSTGQQPRASKVERSTGPPKKKRSRHNKRILRQGGLAPPSASAPSDALLETVQATDPSLYGTAGLAAAPPPIDEVVEQEEKRKEKARTSVVKVVEVGSGKGTRRMQGKDDALTLMLGSGVLGGTGAVETQGWD